MTAAFLFSFLRRHRREVAGLGLWSLVEAVPAFVLGRAVASAIDGFLRRDPAAGLAWLGVLAAAAVAGAAGTRLVYPRLARLTEPLRDDLVRIVVAGALRRSCGGGPADTGALGRLTHQVEIVRDTFAGLLMTGRDVLFSAGAALLGVVTLVPEVAPYVLPPLLIGLALFFAVLRAMIRRQRAYILAGEDLTEAATAAADGMRDVVASGGEERVRESLTVPIEAQARSQRALARLMGARTLILSVAGWGPVVAVLAATPDLVRQGVTAGAIVGALTYLVQGLQPALEGLAAGIGGGLLRLVVILGRILETRVPPPPALPGPALVRPAGFGLELRGVTFAYGERSAPVIDGLDLAIPEGEHLAVVGPSGSGKTTLSGLIAGLLSPRSGEVLLGGAPVRRVQDPPAHRTLVPQEAYVFRGTLEENLAYLNPAARADEVMDAVDRLGMADLTARLGGLGGEVVPDALSGGERQLIVLVRAYLARAPIVILDESTCHLDPSAALRAEEAFAARAGTLIVIAHRMSSAFRARRILVMDGERTAAGRGEDLLDRSPLYRELVGHWEGALEPSGLLRDPDGVDPVSGAGLRDDTGQIVPHRSHGQA